MRDSYFSDQQQCSLQKFKEEYEESVTTEWMGAYINYSAIEYYLFYLKNVYERYHHEYFRNHQVYIEMMPIEAEVQNNMQQVIRFIEEVEKVGQQKMEKFVVYKTNEIVYYWSQLLEIVLENEFSDLSHETYAKKGDMKLLLKILYANIIYMKDFIALNKRIRDCIVGVKKDYVQPFIQRQHYIPLALNMSKEHHEDVMYSNPVEDKVEVHEESVSNVSYNHFCLNLRDSRDRSDTMRQEEHYLDLLLDGTKTLYSSFTYLNRKTEAKLEEFTKFTVKHTSNKNYFLLGLYIGLGLVIFISLIVMLILNLVSFAYDEQKIQSMNYIFPMFRGVGLLILYLWGMAWNVYGFVTYKINFKNILQYGPHYSSHFQIMKRAGFFTLVFCLMLFLYLLGLAINKNSDNRLPIEYTPFVVWTLYFLYIFFPNRQVFNPRGRKYFYTLIKKILLTPFVKMTFLLSYASDQAVSFVIPIKDFAYTVCFYTSNFQQNTDQVKNCLRPDAIEGVIIAYVVAIIPLLIRMVQCFNQARQSTGKFIGHLQMWNFGKYLASVLTATLSFLSSIFPELKTFFIISSIFSTLYSYYWDLKNDWGFLEKGAKHRFLRNNLCYKNPLIYYIAIFLNLIFRCSWTLTISASVIQLFPKSTFLPFLTGLIEILRRCMWNFFRIEKEHVINCAAFSIIKEKPEDILKRLRQKKESRTFNLVDDTESSIIHYVKLSNSEDADYYKKLLDLDLPKTNKELIDTQKNEFLQFYKEEQGKLASSKGDVENHIFFDIKEKYY